MIGEIGLWEIIHKCQHLKFKFSGVYAADNFPVILDTNTFVIVNSDKSVSDGTHWLLYCNRENEFAFADPLGLPLRFYKNIHQRLASAPFAITELIHHQLQHPTSSFCGLYCIYIAHCVFSSYYPCVPLVTEDDLLRFMKHTL